MTDAPQVFLPLPSEGSTAVVAFNGLSVKPGRFQFVNLLRHCSGASLLFVGDPTGNWYNAGLPGVGDTLAEVAKRIEREIAALGATRIITFGASMGGYAAILFGCMLNAERAVATGPQTLLDPLLRFSPPASLPLQAPDLKPFIRNGPCTQIELVAGWEDHLDVFHARRVADLDSVRVLAMRQHVHASAKPLFEEGRLVPLLTQLFAGSAPTDCEVDPQVDSDSDERIAATAYAVNRGDWQTVAERIGMVADRFPTWAGPSFDLGRALAELGDPTGAESAYARAARLSPRWPEPPAYVSSVLLALNRPVEAEQYARRAVEMSQRWAYGHILLARCLSQLGRDRESRTHELRAAELDERFEAAAGSHIP